MIKQHEQLYVVSIIPALRQRQIAVNEIQNPHASSCEALDSLELLKDGQEVLSSKEPLICRTDL